MPDVRLYAQADSHSLCGDGKRGFMANILRRIAQLEAITQPLAPTWEEVEAARKRVGARAMMWLRFAVETVAGVSREQIDEETGPPYLWRWEVIEQDERLLEGATPEQAERDEETLRGADQADARLQRFPRQLQETQAGSAPGNEHIEAVVERLVKQITEQRPSA